MVYFCKADDKVESRDIAATSIGFLEDQWDYPLYDADPRVLSHADKNRTEDGPMTIRCALTVIQDHPADSCHPSQHVFAHDCEERGEIPECELVPPFPPAFEA
jgi:hypothetical protein